MLYPFVTKFGKDYQRKVELGINNSFRVVNELAVVKPLNSEDEFILDLNIWKQLPWSGWKLSRTGYATNGALPLHRVVAYLSGMLDEDPTLHIDHKNMNRLDNREVNLRPCTAIQNGWNVEKKYGHQMRNGKWKFTFSKSFNTMVEAEQCLATGEFQYMSKNRTCFMDETFDTYDEGLTWWKFKAGMHYGEFSPFANQYKSCKEILNESR